ncbi:MAG: ABC transporter transmembrane domain-containing protein, partial [Pseudomonadota bacterium]
QKQIINGLDGDLDTSGLIRLCLEMSAVILVSLGLKWALGYQAGVVGEYVIRRLRNVIYEDSLRPSGDGEPTVPKGTLSTLISTESESIGKFVGSAVSEPVLQWGTMISVVGYIAATQPRLGLIVAMIIIPQALIVIFTQKHINALVRERVLILRHSIDTITATEIYGLKQSVLDDFDAIYEARRKIFIWKLSTKFLLSTLNGIGTILVLGVGGWLALEGKSDVGIVVAATIGLSRIQQPWRSLITFYRNLSAVQVQFELLRVQLEKMQANRPSATAS